MILHPVLRERSKFPPTCSKASGAAGRLLDAVSKAVRDVSVSAALSPTIRRIDIYRLLDAAKAARSAALAATDKAALSFAGACCGRTLTAHLWARQETVAMSRRYMHGAGDRRDDVNPAVQTCRPFGVEHSCVVDGGRLSVPVGGARARIGDATARRTRRRPAGRCLTASAGDRVLLLEICDSVASVRWP